MNHLLSVDLEDRIKLARRDYDGVNESISPQTREIIRNLVYPTPEIRNVRYEVLSFNEVLKPLIDQNDVIVVAGAFFGDESKGKSVDAIANHPDVELVVRVNSGENAGHTIFHDGVKYVFHLVPSGMMTANKINIIGSETVMDPINFLDKEISQLIKNGVDYKQKLFVDDVYIVSPYHKLLDLLGNPENSSTLQGMSPSHASKVSKKGLRLSHLFQDKDVQARRIGSDIDTYLALLQYKGWTKDSILSKCEDMNVKSPGKIPQHIIEFLKRDSKKEQIDFLIDMYKKRVVDNDAFPEFVDTSKMIDETLKNGKKVVLEGAQSYFLSNRVTKHWETTTSADTTAAGIIAAGGYHPTKYRTLIINVNKMPNSRVGNGQNPSAFVSQDFFSKRKVDGLKDLGEACTDFDGITKQLFESIQSDGFLKPTVYKDKTGEYLIGEATQITFAREFGEFGATTKKPRIVGFYDLVHEHEVMQKQGPYTTISALDRFDRCDKIGLVVGYVYYNPSGEPTRVAEGTYRNGDLIKVGDALPNEKVLKHCHKIIKVMDGWKGSPIEAGKRDENAPLHKNLQMVLAEIEFHTGSHILSIGNGQNTSDLLYIKRQ